MSGAATNSNQWSMSDPKFVKAETKKREFRKYLVDSGTLDSVLKYTIGLMEAGQAPEDPQELLVRQSFWMI
jgi:hypothetical protein